MDRPLELSIDDLRRMGADEVVAVNQCSGNSRGLSNPRVAGAQRSHGSYGLVLSIGLHVKPPNGCHLMRRIML